jgi:hypothetical protein
MFDNLAEMKESVMKKLMSLSLVAFSTVLMAQEPQSPAPSIDSQAWVQRRTAAEALVADSNAGLSASAEQKLVSLLDKEDAIVRDAYLKGPAASGLYGEGYSEYVGWLTDQVVRFADSSPEIPELWHALLTCPYDAESKFGRWLAQHGDRVGDFLKNSARGDDPYLRRGDALIMLAQIVAYEHRQASPHKVPEQELQTYQTTVREALSDKTPLVRYKAARALGICGTQQDLLILDSIAIHDPDVVTNGGQSGTEIRYPLRENAKQAAEVLRARLRLEQ